MQWFKRNERLAPPRLWMPIIGPAATMKQKFRQKTIEDIKSLEDAGSPDLAALEAMKLIDHLKKEYGI